MRALAFGVYEAPRANPGTRLKCRLRGDVLVTAVTAARVPWPATRPPQGGGKLAPILTGDLVDAVRRESVATVALYWGVSRYTVSRWRRALGVDRMNDGTRSANDDPPRPRTLTSFSTDGNRSRRMAGNHEPTHISRSGLRPMRADWPLGVDRQRRDELHHVAG